MKHRVEKSSRTDSSRSQAGQIKLIINRIRISVSVCIYLDADIVEEPVCQSPGHQASFLCCCGVGGGQ